MKINVLDHGYVKLIEAWGKGTDGAETNELKPSGSTFGSVGDIYFDYEVGVIEAARQSTQGSFRGWDQDAKLLKYLHTHRHATPFEFAGMVIEVQAPIFVFREWHRHRSQSYNEMSARYSPLPDLYYRPELKAVLERAKSATTNKQAAGIDSGNEGMIALWYREVMEFYDKAEMLYQMGLGVGVPKELARITMPVGHYSRMRAAANLRNWLSFLTLRLDPAAQWEIRQYATAVEQCIAHAFPQTWELFNADRACPMAAPPPRTEAKVTLLEPLATSPLTATAQAPTIALTPKSCGKSHPQVSHITCTLEPGHQGMHTQNGALLWDSPSDRGQ